MVYYYVCKAPQNGGIKFADEFDCHKYLKSQWAVFKGHISNVNVNYSQEVQILFVVWYLQWLFSYFVENIHLVLIPMTSMIL